MSDEALSEDGETQAAVENHKNSQDDRMYQAVDNFMGRQEQTYEEFVAGFTYLTKEDLGKQHPKMAAKPEGTPASTECHSSQSSRSSQIPGTQGSMMEAHGTEDDIEVEVLDEGTRVSTMSKLPGASTGSAMIKVDNFVDCEDLGPDTEDDDDMHDLLGDGGYSASFGVTPGETTHDRGQITLDQDLKASCDVDDRTKPAKIVNAEDIEPQSEANCDEEEELYGDDFINPGEVDSTETIPNIDSYKNQTHLEFKTTAGEIGKTSSATDDLRSSVVPRMSEGLNTQGNAEEVSHDEIETFSLDPTFDYDNVALTPKYSDTDLQILTRSVNINQDSAAS